MNITIIVGWVIAWGMVAYGILGGSSLLLFVNVPSIAVTVGGTIGVLIASFPFTTLKNMPKVFKIALFPPKYDPNAYIAQITDFATTARSKGLLALEDGANKCDDPFLKQAIMLIVDANDPDKVRSMLEDAMDFAAERHSQGKLLLEKGMALAPAFGMIGTLIGLVQMLKNVGGDSSQLGPNMAVALITTFYGSLMANVIFSPLANALKMTHDKEQLCQQLIIEGVMSIAAGSNPRLIKEKLEFMLPKNSGGGGKDGGKSES